MKMKQMNIKTILDTFFVSINIIVAIAGIWSNRLVLYICNTYATGCYTQE
jgi:hypothetical protein